MMEEKKLKVYSKELTEKGMVLGFPMSI